DVLDLEGFKEKSAHNLIASIREAHTVDLGKLLFALGIRHVGEEVADELAQTFGTLATLRSASYETLEALPGIGSRIARSVVDWFMDAHNASMLDRLLPFLKINNPKKSPASAGALAGQ